MFWPLGSGSLNGRTGPDGTSLACACPFPGHQPTWVPDRWLQSPNWRHVARCRRDGSNSEKKKREWSQLDPPLRIDPVRGRTHGASSTRPRGPNSIQTPGPWTWRSMGWCNCQCPGAVINYGRGQSDTCISVLSVSSSESRSARGRGSPARTHAQVREPGALTGTARRSAGSGETRRKSSRGKKKKHPFFFTGGPSQIVLRSGTFERKRQEVCTPSPVSFAPTNAFEASRGITSRR